MPQVSTVVSYTKKELTDLIVAHARTSLGDKAGPSSSTIKFHNTLLEESDKDTQVVQVNFSWGVSPPRHTA